MPSLEDRESIPSAEPAEMDIYTQLGNGLGNLSAAQRREIYDDLRAMLNLHKNEPMLPLPTPELATWSRRSAEIIGAALARSQATRMVADVAMLEAGFLEYGKPPTDAFLDSQLAIGPSVRSAGLSGLYIHAILNPVALAGARRAAREVLSASLAALVEERYPAVVMLRHALCQEGALGTSGMIEGERAGNNVIS